MKNIRKALALLLALCMIMGLAACGNKTADESKAPFANEVLS